MKSGHRPQHPDRVLSGTGNRESSSAGLFGKFSLDPSTGGFEFLARAAFIATALYVLNTGLSVYRGSGIWAPGIPVGLTLYGLAFFCLIAGIMLRNPTRLVWQLAIGGILLTTIIFAVWYEIDFANPTYGTDSLAFAQSAGEVLINGQNPYEVVGGSLGDVIERFNVPDTFVTRTTAGTEIERLVSYPAGHVLTYAGGVAVGLHDLRWVTLIFEIGSLVLIWSFVSPIGRLFIPFALLMEPNLTVYFTSGAVTDWLWVLPLVCAAFFLNRERFGYAGLALGLACAMKQQPWFLVPFAFVWAYQTLSRRGKSQERRDGLIAFLGGVAFGFLLLNIPFIVWSFHDWVQGILHPVLGHLVPDGQGLSVLTSRGLLPIPGGWYSTALLLVSALTLWAYARWFDRMQNLLFVLPPALFLISARSFHSYFIYWAPLALLWLDLRLNRPGPADQAVKKVGFRSVQSRLFALIAMAVAVGLAAAAILSVSERSIDVGEVAPIVEDGLIKSLRVDITNLTDEAIEPVFEVYWIGSPVPWEPVGETRVAARSSSTVTIRPASPQGIPPVQLSPSGEAAVMDFRVRVNDSGSSIYSASDVIHVKLDDPVINPTLVDWGREATVFAAPYGWRAVAHGGTDEQRSIRSTGMGAGAALTVASYGAGPADWVEAALIQDVASFAPCYVWDFDHDLGFRADDAGSPLAVAGVQIVQEDVSLWFVASDGADGQTSTLADGTLLVEVGAIPNHRVSAVLDVASYAQDAGIDLGQGGIIKLFNAVHETIAAHSESTTYGLWGGCATS